MSNVLTERRPEPSTTSARQAAPAANAVQLKSALRGADLDVQMAMLEPRDAAPAPPPGQAAATEPAITIQSGVDVTAGMVATLKKILQSAKLSSATITSGARSAQKQAEAMYNNTVATGAAAQKALYGNPGDKVIDVYVAEHKAGKSAADIKSAMRDKIIELGPETVSKHCSETHDTIDVSNGSITDAAAFKVALNKALADGDISKFIAPGGGEPAFHIEKPK